MIALAMITVITVIITQPGTSPRSFLPCNRENAFHSVMLFLSVGRRYGASRFMWASDFPHADHTPAYVDDLDELAASLPEGPRRQRFLGDNARELFKIDA